MPAGGVAGGLASLLESVEQRQLGAVPDGPDLQAEDVRAPTELHERLVLIGEHLALHRRGLAAGEREAEGCARGPFALDRRREPFRQVLGLCDGVPDLRFWIGELAGEAKLPPAIVELFDAPVAPLMLVRGHAASIQSDIRSKCRSRSSRLTAHIRT